MKKNYLIFILLISLTAIQAQQTPQLPIKLSLTEAIEIARDSSLNAFRVKNIYMSSYWQYRTYKANQLPALEFSSNPFQYNRNFIKRYDSQNDIDVFKIQQNMYSYANLSLRQNIGLTGGTLFLDSDIGYLQTFGVDKIEQFSTVPIRIGYSQSLFGYNRLKWEKRLEPLRFEKAKKELIYDMEEIAEYTTDYFFNHILAQKLLDIARQDKKNSEEMYEIGLERQKIAAISQADLLTLKLYAVNAKNSYINAENDWFRSSFLLASFLRFDSNTLFELELPTDIKAMVISPDEAIIHTKNNNPKYDELKEQILSAQQNLDLAEKNSRFSASISASVGFNQVASNFSKAYHAPLQQDVVSLGISIPLVDWGVRKGQVNMAKNNLNTIKISSQQAEMALEQEITITVNDFNQRLSQIESAEEALKISELAYEETKQRFIIGKSDVNSLNMALTRQTDAQRAYIYAINNYWKTYFKIRKLTLYDYYKNESIELDFDELEFLQQ